MKVKLKKATDLQKAKWAANPREIYPLWGYASMRHGTACPVEDLRGSWGRPDPVWEVHAPDGYHFYDGTHSLLCHDQADIRDRLEYETLVRCDGDCGGWIGEEIVNNPAPINEGDLN